MTVANNFAAKLTVAFVASAMAISAFAPAAQAQSVDELTEQVNSLTALIATLQAQLGGGTTAAPAAAAGVCPYTWTRNLTSGDTGMDVMKLQQFLNADADTRVAATGAGSAGMETEYYGPATGAAVAKFQAKYRADILSPLGLVNPTPFFGPSTRDKANMLCTTAPVVVPPVDGGDDDMMEEDEDEDTASADLDGEGTLATFEIDDDEDEVSEGEEDVSVLKLTLEAEDGDIEVDRMTFTLQAVDAPTLNEEEDPWDVFEEVSLWVDGDKIASFEADDEDNYLDEDIGEFRFSGLGLILREDDETEIYVAVSVMNSVDGSDTANAADWDIEPTEVRFYDADGVATTEDDIDEMENDADDSEEFDIVEEGTDDGADVESNSNNPDATTLLVDEDSDDSDEFVVHIFDIEVDSDSGDLELGDAYVDVTVTNANPAAAITGGQEEVIESIFMTIDGETVEGEAITTGAPDDEDDAIALNGGTTTVRYLFEFDQDVVLEGDTDYDVEISMVFLGQDSNYVNGVTVETEVDGSLWEVEGSADDDELSGTDDSEVHTLATVVPVITDTSFSTERNEATTQGTISFEFTVEADGDNDVVIDVADNDDVDGSTDDIRFTITGGAAAGTATGTLALIDGDATYDGGANTWTINDGDEATFALDVSIDGTDGAGTYRVTVETIAGVEVDETSTGMVLVSS